MLISKEQCKYNVADIQDNREKVRSINFCIEGAVSTDGKRILIVPYPAYEDNDLFETEEAKADSKYKLSKNESIMVDAQSAKHLSCNFFKASEQENIIGTLAAVDVRDKKIFVSMVSDLVDKEFEIPNIQANPVDWKKIIPKSKVTQTTVFDIDLLIDLLKKIKGAAPKENRTIEFKFRGDGGIVEISTRDNGFGLGIKSYIMPMRDKE